MSIISSQLTTDPMAGIRALQNELKAVEHLYEENKDIHIRYVSPKQKMFKQAYEDRYIQRALNYYKQSYSEHLDNIQLIKLEEIKKHKQNNFVRKSIASLIELKLKDQIEVNPHISLIAINPNIKWRNRSNLLVDIHGFFEGTPFVIEYDGLYWHSSEKRFQDDSEKTLLLLENKYKVIRVREKTLPHLPIEHSNLLQISYLGNTNHLLCDFTEILPSIFEFLS